MWKSTRIALLSMLCMHAVHASADNQVPSCYKANNMEVPAAEKEVYFLIDQTTRMDDGIRSAVIRHAGALVAPGSSFVVASFSAFSQGKYVEILAEGTLEPVFPEKDRADTGVKVLKNIDSCLAKQKDYGRKVAATAIKKALSGQDTELAKSDVMASLKELSKRVRDSGEGNKIVLVVSDMLENSSVSSFYAKNAVREIQPSKELEAAAKADLFGDFGGARVHVMGTGLLAEEVTKNKAAYRSPQVMKALTDFWQAWFEKSKAKVIEIGQPTLLRGVN